MLTVNLWVLACVGLTIFLCVTAYSLGGHLNVGQIVLWCGLTLAIIGAASLILLLRHEPSQLYSLMAPAIGMSLLAGINLAAYSAMKQNLNIVGFGADPMLAAWDRIIFGADPIRWLHGMLDFIHPEFYYFGWIGVVAATIAYVSAFHTDRDILLPLYFLCWTIFGPVLHLMMPAGGPIFFQRLGHGDRFADIPIHEHVQHYADYLWNAYQSGEQVVGGGISAMPSLHIMTVAWVVLSLSKARIAPLIYLWALIIFLLSIATAWHYAVDGFISALAVIAGWYALKTGKYGRRATHQSRLVES